MKHSIPLSVCGFFIACTTCFSSLPNIVVMLADDMGFGEVQILNPERGKIKTPQLDQLARDGMIFTDAHSGSSVCTPTRYGLMTGRYAWRTRLQNGVLTGGESLIAQDRLTIAKLLKEKGYATAMCGKWHLGMLFNGESNSGQVPVGSKVTHGPVDRGGFDEFHGFHHARQMNLWIDNDTVTEKIEPVEMLPKLVETAVKFITGRKGKAPPFFLYVPWNSPHSPVVPSDAWKGKSGLNAHADFVMQTDDAFGQVVAALKENGFYENTLIICSADNGTSSGTANIPQLNALGHFPSGDLRGSKADIWDGGHRVPFIASWPAVLKAGQRTDALICLTDVLATASEIVGATIPATDAEDSFSFLSVLKGEKNGERAPVIHHSIEGQFAIRDGRWKLICCPGSGGWSKPGTQTALKEAVANDLPLVQLYDMVADLGEQTNLAAERGEIVVKMRHALDQQIEAGRSTPGPQQANDAPITVDKWNKAPAAKKKSKK